MVGSSSSLLSRTKATILLSTLNKKCGLIWERKKESSVFKFSLSRSWAIRSILTLSETDLKTVPIKAKNKKKSALNVIPLKKE